MRLMSAVDSRSPIWISLLKSGMGWPPRCRTATSKDTLVRLLGLWKIMARLRRAGGGPGSAPAFSAEATSRTSVISAAERSAIEIRSRPAREPIWGLCSHPTPPAACGSRHSPLHHCYGYARNESAGAGVGPSGGDPAGLAAAADARRRVPRGGDHARVRARRGPGRARPGGRGRRCCPPSRGRAVPPAPGPAPADLPSPASRTTAWEPERWAHLPNQLATRHGAAIVFVGAAEDEAAATTAATDIAAPHADFTGQLDVLGTAALLQRCDLVICGDSPPLHLAAAVGTPTIGLFGPTDGRRRGAYGAEHRVVQALPQHRGHHLMSGPDGMMEQIRVEDVLAAIETAL